LSSTGQRITGTSVTGCYPQKIGIGSAIEVVE
jgi:hypothetical protein